MYKRNHDDTDNSFFEGDDYHLIIRQPGACQITKPAGYHFLDIYIGKANGTYIIPGLENLGDSLPPKSFVFLPANGEREIISSRSGLSIQLIFSEQLLDRLLANDPPIDALGVRTICHAHDEAMAGLAQLLATAWTEGFSDPTEEEIKAVVLLMAARVTHHFSKFVDKVAQKTTSSSKRVQSVLEYIENNLQRTLSLEELASVAGISPYHFARVFRKTTTRSPHQYVVERRLSKAKQLLSQSDDSIAQIAFDCGFSSQSHMTDVFNRMLHITPGALRKTQFNAV